MDRSKRLVEEKVHSLLIKFSIPAMTGMLVNALYSIIDRVYVGNLIGTDALTGLTIVFPFMLLMLAVYMLFSMGGTVFIAISLGQKNREKAEKILGNNFVLLITASVAVTVIGLIFIDPILFALGAKGVGVTASAYAKTYLQIILLGSLFNGVAFGMNASVRSEGNPKIAMFTMLIGAVLNTILAPIFIIWFHWGVAGSAWATVVSQFVSMAWILQYFTLGKSSLKIHIKNLALEAKIVGKIVSLGVAQFTMQFITSVIAVLYTHLLYIYGKGLGPNGGDIAVAAYGVIFSVNQVAFMPLYGINQGAQPIIGYNFGAKNYDRVKHTEKLAIIGAVCVATAIFLVVEIFPHIIIKAFSQDATLISFTSKAIRIFAAMWPLAAIQIINSNYFQSIGKTTKATFLTLSRQVLFLIPLLLIFPIFWGIFGIMIATAAADFLSTSLTFSIFLHDIRRLGKEA